MVSLIQRMRWRFVVCHIPMRDLHANRLGGMRDTSWIDNRTILTPTGGFLASGFTHTIGLRTKRTDFEQRLKEAGYAEWMTLEKFWQVKDVLAKRLGAERVLVSCEGFNAVG